MKRLLQRFTNMPGIKISTLSLLLAVTAGARTDYFPLAAGNVWHYQCTGACGGQATVLMQVTGTRTVQDQTYFVVQGPNTSPWFSFQTWVRSDGSGALIQYDQDALRESTWYDFSAAKPSRYQGPAGTFDNAVEIDSADSQDWFVPGLGLVARRTATLALDLISVRRGGTRVTAPTDLAVQISLDQPSSSASLSARLTVRNTTGQPVTLTFPTGQIYDLEIRNATNDVVYRWSRDKVFTQIFASLGLQGEKTWTIVAPLTNLPAGRYVVQAWLAVEGPPRAYSASTAFDLKP